MYQFFATYNAELMALAMGLQWSWSCRKCIFLLCKGLSVQLSPWLLWLCY